MLHREIGMSLDDCKHVHFEPMYLSDVRIKYQDTYYHVHRVVLAGQCEYFANLFATSPDTILVELPILVVPFFGLGNVDDDRMEKFITYLYTQKIADLLTKHKLVHAVNNYLSYYFRCTELQAEIQQRSIDWLKEHGGRVSLRLLFGWVSECEMYRTTELHSDIIKRIAKSINTAAATISAESCPLYTAMSQATKALILDNILLQRWSER